MATATSAPASAHSSGAHETRAFVLRRVEYGEADLILGFFTEELGRVTALARGARRSKKRFTGTLEPMHTLRLHLDDPRQGELMLLRDASIEKPRDAMSLELERLEAAGRALGWIRRAAPPRTPEPAVWDALEKLLDELCVTGPTTPQQRLAASGLALLSAFGWAIDFERCVRCGKPCPSGQASMIDPARGGLVCRSCGGAKLRLDGPTRLRLLAASLGTRELLTIDDARTGLDIVEQALRAHAGFE